MRWSNSMRTVSTDFVDDGPSVVVSFDELLEEMSYLRRELGKPAPREPGVNQDEWDSFWDGIIGANEPPLGGHTVRSHASAMLWAHAQKRASDDVRALLRWRVARAAKQLRAVRSLALYEAGSPTGVLVGHTMRTRYVRMLGDGSLLLSWVVALDL